MYSDRNFEFMEFTSQTHEEEKLAKKICAQQESLRERTACDFIAAILSRHNHWTCVQINPMSYVRSEGSYIQVLQKYRHLLQPDMDVLFGDWQDGRKTTPLQAIEVKVFRPTSRRLDGKPKPQRSFYEGLGQALVLYQYGIDYVSLWHVFVLPEATHQRLIKERASVAKLWEDNEPFEDMLIAEYLERLRAYSELVHGTILQLNSSIGYETLLLLISSNQVFYAFHPEYRRLPAFNVLTSTGAGLRRLLRERLDIQETVYNPSYEP